MKTRTLGAGGLEVSALGLGCTGMPEFDEGRDDAESLATPERAIEAGITFLDTAGMYGSGADETLIGPVVRRHRDRVVLATRFGVPRGPNGSFDGLTGRPDDARAACEASLARLGVEVIDLHDQHRVDPSVSIEATVGARALPAAGMMHTRTGAYRSRPRWARWPAWWWRPRCVTSDRPRRRPR